MTNHEIVGKGFAILREYLAPYVVQQIQQIQAYIGNDLWWTEGVVAQLSEREQNDLYYGNDYGQRIDSLDVAACLNLIERHWNNLFRFVLPKSARSWAKEAKDFRNQWAHIGGHDFTQQEVERALDTMSLLAGEFDPTTQEELRKLLRTVRYGSEQGSMASTSNGSDVGAGRKSLGVMQSTPVSGLPCWRNVIEPHPDVAQGRYKNAEFAADIFC